MTFIHINTDGEESTHMIPADCTERFRDVIGGQESRTMGDDDALVAVEATDTTVHIVSASCANDLRAIIDKSDCPADTIQRDSHTSPEPRPKVSN